MSIKLQTRWLRLLLIVLVMMSIAACGGGEPEEALTMAQEASAEDLSEPLSAVQGVATLDDASVSEVSVEVSEVSAEGEAGERRFRMSVSLQVEEDQATQETAEALLTTLQENFDTTELNVVVFVLTPGDEDPSYFYYSFENDEWQQADEPLEYDESDESDEE